VTADDLLNCLTKDQHKFEQAEEMHRQALRLCETVLGEEHPSVLTSINNVASERVAIASAGRSSRHAGFSKLAVAFMTIGREANGR
jgi:hypothetical protein